VGVAELKIAVERTGGLVVLAESFGHSVFKESLRRVSRRVTVILIYHQSKGSFNSFKYCLVK
jgi:hypothetical protein